MLKTPALLFLLFLLNQVFGQSENLVISGRVTDHKNTPLAYASVGIAQKRLGTITNKNGEFSIKLSASSAGDTLLISLLGYEPVRLSIASISHTTALAIKLTEKPVILEEVVVKAIDPVQLIRTAI